MELLALEPSPVPDANITKTCPESIVSNALRWTTIAVAVVILVVLSFAQRRANSWKSCLRPGIVIPLNLVRASPHRLIYAAIFGTMSGDVLSFAQNYADFLPSTHQPYLNIFIATILSPIVLVLFLSAKYFPVFAGVSSPVPPLGHVLGLLYSCLLFAYNAYEDWAQNYCKVSEQQYGNGSYKVILGVDVASRIPGYVLSAIILVWYVVQVLRDILVVYGKGLQEACQPPQEGHRYYDHYVRCLLRRRTPGERAGYITRGIRYLCPYGLSPLKLPLKFVGALVIMLVLMYQLTFILVGLGIYAGHRYVQSWKDHKVEIKQFLRKIDFSEGLYADGLSLLNGFAVVIPGAPMVSFIFCLALMVHMAACIFENLRKTIRGDFSFLSGKFSPGAFTVSASWRYAGYQVAFFIAAYFIYTSVLWLLGALGIAAYFGFKYYKDYMLQVLTAILLFPSWTLIVLLSQVAVCHLVFLRKGGGMFAVITNMRLFHWVTYVLFFYGAVLGLVSSILRMLASLVFSLLLLIRLDRVVLMRGFEFFDLGHKTYVGFLYLEYTYNNPVVNVFVKQLGRNICTTEWRPHPIPRHQFEASEILESDPEASVPFVKSDSHSTYGAYRTGNINNSFTDGVSSCKSQRALNRWLVAYTLLRNPSLQGLTASRLQEGKRETDEYCHSSFKDSTAKLEC